MGWLSVGWCCVVPRYALSLRVTEKAFASQWMLGYVTVKLGHVGGVPWVAADCSLQSENNNLTFYSILSQLLRRWCKLSRKIQLGVQENTEFCFQAMTELWCRLYVTVGRMLLFLQSTPSGDLTPPHMGHKKFQSIFSELISNWK